ncbi:Alg9-like mannosyltransferase family-domain-containing protein [Radiomyces spectabilis]|uniref:Alg9-like mannosyltransferase family-domain-containing protein n=1 Tax=Radiomyces spectabilis TaxID=64574 RepID=UPI00222089A6|nr:Alg9-like mannosyltransferase family-domain-containing protein [Radiomyces spectabilis]KAI8377902.1 Alg9-like mannosyltransferase family-domain-containing protein [Radiomyces spectabilis]
MIRFLTFAGIVFRFEVGILLVVIASLEWIVYGTLPLSVILVEGFITAVASLALTVPLDSYFWQRWLWPEGEVFYFNAILNKSSEWGTSPWYTYFVLFLPKLLFISYPLAWIGFVSHPRVRRIMVPGLIYIGLFSFLPHKEWRFIIYTIPLFTAAAASTVAQVSIQCRRSLIRRLAFLLMLAGMTISLAASLLMFTISQANYPGGHALRDLHMSEHPLRPISVHLDVPTAMTGASRFGQKNRRWQYHKTESHAHPDDYLESEYTHLITADPSFHDSAFKTVHVTYGYSGLRIKSINAYLEGITKNPTSWHSWVPIQVRITPKLYTMKLVDPQTTWVDFTLRKHPMVVYSKTYCPYCNAAKQLLNRYCPDAYFVIEVDKRPDGLQIKQALIQRSGRHTFPQVYVQGKILGGYDDLLTLETQKGLADRLVCDDDKLAKHSNIGG